MTETSRPTTLSAVFSRTRRGTPFSDSDGFRARLKGFSGTATLGQTTNIDYLVSEERYINGAQLILQNQVFGDKVNFEIVDVDDILGLGAGTVLDTFAEDWFIDSSNMNQQIIKIEYPAKILAGLYVRVKYTSTGASNVDVRCNLLLHKKI